MEGNEEPRQDSGLKLPPFACASSYLGGLGGCVPTTGNLPVYVTELVAGSGVDTILHPGHCVDVEKGGGW